MQRKQMHEQIIENQTVNLDGHDWFGCSFRNCVLHIEIGDFSFSNNNVFDCKLSFGGTATAVIAMIELFYPGRLPFNGDDRPNPRGKGFF